LENIRHGIGTQKWPNKISYFGKKYSRSEDKKWVVDEMMGGKWWG